MLDIEHHILALEEALRQAMLASDTAALERLISDDLIFTNHLGQLLTKQADLQMHGSGLLRFSALEPSEQILQLGPQLAVVSVRMRLAGTFSGTAFADDLRFTRIWQPAATGWQVLAGHSCTVQA